MTIAVPGDGGRMFLEPSRQQLPLRQVGEFAITGGPVRFD
jgi:hypothetical protein